MPILPTHLDRTLQPMVSNISSESGSKHMQNDHDKAFGLKLAADNKKTPTCFSIPTDSVLVGPTCSSPSKSLSDDSSHTNTTDTDDEFDASTLIKQISKSDHKIAEERGFHVAEPLLKENPHRFVLFPIEDDEVSNN